MSTDLTATGVPDGPRYRPLMYLSATVQQELAVARPMPDSKLAICYFSGGTFQGERLAGVVLPGGGDWADCRSADHVEIDVRAVMKTTDGALVYLKYAGLWWTPPGVLTTVIAVGGHKHFDPAENYFRTVARFETADARYAWLNRIIAIGIGTRTADGVGHHFYELV